MYDLHLCQTVAGEQQLSPTGPMVIDFSSLKTPVVAIKKEGQDAVVAPMVVHTPAILKIVLLQAEATPTSVNSSTQNMDVISLSGVVLRHSQSVWQLAEGFNYHEIPQQSVENIEGFTIRGGIRVLFSHTYRKWYVLPPLPPAQPHPPQQAAPSSQQHK